MASIIFAFLYWLEVNDVVVPDAAIQIDDKIAAASAAVDKNVIQVDK